MRKTLPKHFTEVIEKQASVKRNGDNSEQLVELMKDMKGTWNEAANDLLQPRPEVIAQLLKKVLH
jgi:hypothetical protein